MRLTIALLTGAFLSSAAYAQSVMPGLDPALPQVALAPTVVELPVAAIGPAAVGLPTAATAAPETLPRHAAPPVAGFAGTKAPASPRADAPDHALEKAVNAHERSAKPQPASAEHRARSRVPRIREQPSYSRPHQVRRDVGRFWPPVF